jgi:hypothetical protein
VSTETGPESMEPVCRGMPRTGGRSVPRVRGRTVAVFSVLVLGLLTLGAPVFSIVTPPRLSTVPTVESQKPTSLKPGQFRDRRQREIARHRQRCSSGSTGCQHPRLGSVTDRSDPAWPPAPASWVPGNIFRWIKPGVS